MDDLCQGTDKEKVADHFKNAFDHNYQDKLNEMVLGICGRYSMTIKEYCERLGIEDSLVERGVQLEFDELGLIVMTKIPLAPVEDPKFLEETVNVLSMLRVPTDISRRLIGEYQERISFDSALSMSDSIIVWSSLDFHSCTGPGSIKVRHYFESAFKKRRISVDYVRTLSPEHFLWVEAILLSQFSGFKKLIKDDNTYALLHFGDTLRHALSMLAMQGNTLIAKGEITLAHLKQIDEIVKVNRITLGDFDCDFSSKEKVESWIGENSDENSD
jgi:hypothetical protein